MLEETSTATRTAPTAVKRIEDDTNISIYSHSQKTNLLYTMKKYIILACAVIAAACNSGNNKKGTDAVAISIESIKAENVAVDSIENCSYTGFSGVSGDSLYFFDRVMSYLYTISKDGHVGSRQLGLGRSSNELPVKNPVQVCYETEGQTFDIMGGTYDMYFYGKDKKTVRMDMVPEGSNDSFESSTAYTLWDEVIMASNKDFIYYNILGNNEKVDIFNREDYIDKAAVIMKVAKKDGKMTPIGRYSDYYAKNKEKIKHLPYYYFDTDGKGGFYFTYQADSLVYHYDENFNVIESFGRQGRDMYTEYSDPGKTTETFVEAFMADKEKAGRYYWIKRCGDYVFRSYFKSAGSDSDGLQIYRDGTLIGDVDVPHGFRVAGRCGDYFVTDINLDEDNGTMSFYKFKLE